MNTQITEQQQVTLKQLKPFYGPVQAVHPVDVTIYPRSVTAIIGPSGCGKSTVLRCINRMHETIAFARVEGQVLLGEQDIYAPGIEAQAVRRRIGMVFQQPNPLKMLSIFENVAIGLRLEGYSRAAIAERVELSLQAAADIRIPHARVERVGVIQARHALVHRAAESSAPHSASDLRFTNYDCDELNRKS